MEHPAGAGDISAIGTGSDIRIPFDMQIRIEDNECMGFMGCRSVIDLGYGRLLPGLPPFV
jgi:hypothetical protein